MSAYGFSREDHARVSRAVRRLESMAGNLTATRRGPRGGSGGGTTTAASPLLPAVLVKATDEDQDAWLSSFDIDQRSHDGKGIPAPKVTYAGGKLTVTPGLGKAILLTTEATEPVTFVASRNRRAIARSSAAFTDADSTVSIVSSSFEVLSGDPVTAPASVTNPDDLSGATTDTLLLELVGSTWTLIDVLDSSESPQEAGLVDVWLIMGTEGVPLPDESVESGTPKPQAKFLWVQLRGGRYEVVAADCGQLNLSEA